jgi:hypothetical protein
MRFGGRGVCRQSFDASLRALLRATPFDARRVALSKPLPQGRVEARRADIASLRCNIRANRDDAVGGTAN